MSIISQFAYIAASILFCVGLKMLSRADTARRGNQISAIGMLIAVLATLITGGMNYIWIIAGVVVGAGIGSVAARKVEMTGMPEMVALFNGFGGIASLLEHSAQVAEIKKYVSKLILDRNFENSDFFVI